MHIRVRGFIGCLGVLLVAHVGTASVIVDGQLDDWGVTPFVDWVPDLSASYVEENWGDHPGEYGAYPHGGEAYDQEAIYAHVDADILYIAIVTSIPESGNKYRSHQIMPGDLAIDVGADGAYDYGVVGYGSDKGEVYLGPDWSTPHGFVGFPSAGPSTLSGGTYLDTIDFVYADAGRLEGGSTHTYILEMALELSLLNQPTGALSLHHVMTCANDPLDLQIGLQHIPEPATIGLVLSGAALVFGARRRYC